MRAEYSLLNRNGIYYVRLWNEQQGVYLTPKSTRCRNKAEAIKIARQWAKDYKNSHGITRHSELVSYARDFWTWGKSSYIEKKRLIDPDGITEAYAAYNLHYIVEYATKYFGRKRLCDLRANDFESYLLHLKGKLPDFSNSTINRIVRAVTQPVKEAYRLQIIDENPVRGAFRLPEHAREKGIFTTTEIEALARIEWNDARAKEAFRLAAICGLRLGEVRALRNEDLLGNRLVIQHSFSKTSGLKCPKNRRSRSVSIPAELATSLRNLATQNPHNDSYVFWGSKPGVPLGDRTIFEGLYRAMQAIGIDEESRRERCLSFHSLRHWTNASLRGSISDEKLRKLIGHVDPRMTDRYDHLTSEDFREIEEAQERRLTPHLVPIKEAS